MIRCPRSMGSRISRFSNSSWLCDRAGHFKRRDHLWSFNPQKARFAAYIPMFSMLARPADRRHVPVWTWKLRCSCAMLSEATQAVSGQAATAKSGEFSNTPHADEPLQISVWGNERWGDGPAAGDGYPTKSFQAVLTRLTFASREAKRNARRLDKVCPSKIRNEFAPRSQNRMG
ncbi:hypothetical protein EVG20_g2219 [Dentipellis fragilis]|uniref:Uncharacterized protein n=1 Tax=Dentipellis fragilis TaxID=205917 RepID=A0A4Y9Z7Q4_9AGAM|nr:hypothetical protein EVG20_g2219 [Dentipellis fragilis]